MSSVRQAPNRTIEVAEEIFWVGEQITDARSNGGG
jgi:hypothetical protein